MDLRIELIFSDTERLDRDRVGEIKFSIREVRPVYIHWLVSSNKYLGDYRKQLLRNIWQASVASLKCPLSRYMAIVESLFIIDS